MTLLVAIDFSEVSERMLDVVRRVPGIDSCKVFLVHAAEPEPDFVGWEAGPDVVRDQMAAQFRREFEQIGVMAERLRSDGIDASGLVVQGPTVATVVDEVRRRGAELLVIGSHGHGAAYDLAIGSTSAELIRKATVPVLVVPAREVS